jgi:hypothetical protein
MFKPAQWFCMAAGVIFGLATLSMPQSASAEEAPTIRLAQSGGPGYYRYDRAPSNDGYVERAPEGGSEAYRAPRADAWRAPPQGQAYDPAQQDDRYASQDASRGRYYGQSGQYGEPYERDYGRGGYPPPRRDYDDGTFSPGEIRDAGHGFFGSVSKGLANVIEYAFQKQGRPNGYILGEDLSGAFVAGLRYGEGWLYTRDAGRHKVFWQGPSIGYDAAAEGSKVMVLVYNMRDPYDIYHRFGGVNGSAYVVGGVGVMFQTYGDVVMAPIRAGVGLRFGANVGYLKYTPRPTWNPF